MNQKPFIIAGCVILLALGGYLAFRPAHPTLAPTVPVATSTPASGGTDAGIPPPVTATPVPPAGTAPSAAMISQADNGKTVVLTKGQRFGIAMGDALEWSLSFDPDGIVTRVTNISTIRGEQGVYTAAAAGTTVLTATGAPICDPGQMCPQFRQTVTVTLVVR